jgi:hypothetical protein
MERAVVILEGSSAGSLRFLTQGSPYADCQGLDLKLLGGYQRTCSSLVGRRRYDESTDGREWPTSDGSVVAV